MYISENRELKLKSNCFTAVRCAVWVFGLCATFGAHAVNSFDLATGRLSLDSVSVGGTTYSDVAVTVNAYALQSVAGGAPGATSFDPTSNILMLGTVSFQGATYNNVRVRIDSYALTANTYSDCANNSALMAVGSTYQTVMQGTDQSVASTNTTVNRTTTYNGVNALEVQADSVILAGANTGATISTKSYMPVAANSINTLGTATTLTIPAQGSLVVSLAYSPAIQSPLNLALNSPASQNVSVVTTNSLTGSLTAATAQTLTYQGMEVVSVPAGTFMTCKVRSDNVTSSGNSSASASLTSWRIASGSYRGLVVKTLDNKTSVQSVATKLSLNGG